MYEREGREVPPFIINTMNTAPKTSNQIRNGLERQKQLYHTIPNIPLEPDIATDIIHFETFCVVNKSSE